MMRNGVDFIGETPQTSSKRVVPVAATVVALLLWGLLLAYTASPAQAATITVNSLADTAGSARLGRP